MTKILLVEDDKSLREIYGVRLLAEGYDIISAGDGEEALAMAIKDRPSLIVSDVMMPKISGFDMLDILRSTTETKDIKVIMMTALSSEDQRKRGEQLGADRYLVKSQVGIEDVVRTVHEVLGDAPISPSASPFASTPTPSTQPATPPAQPLAANSAPAERPAMASPAPRPVFHGTPSNPSPAPQTSTLPQPTAPFSTPRPNPGSGRIIEPVNMPTSSDQASIANRLDDELRSSNQATPAPQPAPVAPNVGPAPSVTPPSAPAPTPAPQQMPAPQSSQPPQPQQTPPLPPTQPTPGQPS